MRVFILGPNSARSNIFSANMHAIGCRWTTQVAEQHYGIFSVVVELCFYCLCFVFTLTAKKKCIYCMILVLAASTFRLWK